MEKFNASSSAEDVLNDVELTGKRILITGVSSGIGMETARALIAQGAEVVGTVRDPLKGEAAARIIIGSQDPRKLRILRLDLASIRDVRGRVDDLVADYRHFDLVIANAGVMATPFSKTVDGFETQFGTNHLGHFALVNGVLPLLKPGSRVICLASSGHAIANVDLDDPNFDRTPYDPWVAYGRSKTANILFAVEFDRRHRERGIRAAAVHPGGVRTELLRHIGEQSYAAMIANINAKLAAEGRPPYKTKTLAQGAATTLWAGLLAASEIVGGKYCENCHVSSITDGPIGAVDEGVRGYAMDQENARALWDKSLEMLRDC